MNFCVLGLKADLFFLILICIFLDVFQLRALSLVKLKGPIEKDDPNAVRKKLSPKAQEQIEKKAYEDNEKGTSSHGDWLKFELLYF